MLAEPRSRRSYTLVPKGKPLYEDETRFGTKLMQKMGWTKGKGLGRDGSGSKDFLRVRYKNDAKGLGFEARDDQWTQHEQSFNGLLSMLNGNEKGENGKLYKAKRDISNESDDEAPRLGFGFQETTIREEIKPKVEKVAKLKEKISGISLEEKSKKSRARVHYQKFTRGKDLSQYSEKDLANIFGKKVGEESYNAHGQQEEQPNAEETNEEINVQFLHTGISVSDYFKMKMQAKKNLSGNEDKKTISLKSSGYTENNSDMDDNQQYEEDSKKKKKRKKERKSKGTENEQKVEEDAVKKKEKKSKKNKQKYLEDVNAIEKENQYTNTEVVDALQQKSKKSKKSKKSLEHMQPQREELEKELKYNVNENKRKHENLENESKEQSENTIIDINLRDEPQKKKHKKIKYETMSNEKSTEIETTESRQTSPEKLKKKKPEELTADQQKASEGHLKSNKNKTKDVSCDDNDVLTKNANSQVLEFNEIEKLVNSYNVYNISSFSAEKFRNLNFSIFKGSTLSQIEGYGFNKDIQLEVYINEKDEERITNLWKGILDKYTHLEKPKNTYQLYVKEVINACKMKQKRPKLHIKTWQRKNAFQTI